jgi:hypothetical protein
VSFSPLPWVETCVVNTNTNTLRTVGLFDFVNAHATGC